MATIGSLSVNITAVTSGFEKGMRKAQALAGGFVGKIKGIGKSVASLATSANAVQAIVAAAAGMVVNSALEAGGQLFALTKKARISAEALSALHYAADQLESSAVAVDSGLLKMNRTLGESLLGSKGSAAAFGQLGLNIKTLSEMPVEERFLAVVDALHGIGDESKRASIAQSIFGRGYEELLPLIEAGTAAIVQQGQAAADLGAIMGGETAKGLNDAGDALKSAGTQWRAFKNEAVAAFAPVIEFVSWLGTKALQTVKTFGGIIQTVIVGSVELASRALLVLAETVNALLPKSMEFDTEKIKSYVDSFAAMRKSTAAATEGNAQKLLGWAGGGAAGGPSAQKNPLQAPAQNKVEQNTAAINDSMQILITEMRRQNSKPEASAEPAGQPVVLASAGVR
jgi:hypothetical protein